MKLVLSALLLVTTPAFAGPIKVSEEKAPAYKYVQIDAKKVKGVQVQLKQEVTRTDCNSIGLFANPVRIDGNDFNWWSTFFVTASMSKTEMYCPEKPTKEIVTSEKLVFESYSNENLDREVKITLILPASFDVVVTELK